MTIAVVSAFGVATLAQQPQGPPPERGTRSEVMGRRGGMEGRERMRRPGARGMMRGLRELNLTDAQKQQVRATFQRNMEGTKAQRQELRQLAEKRRQGTLTPEEEARTRTLRDQLFNSMKGTHADLLAILTPEQKTRLEEIEKTRKERHKEMRERHKEKGDRPAPPSLN
jgi:Spy/CpxP family protein refolding chaperone